GSDQVFAGLEIDARFSADGTVDLSEQGGGNLDEGDATQITGGDETREVTDDTAAECDDEGLAFQAMRGEFVETLFHELHALGFFTGGNRHRDGFEAGIFYRFKRGSEKAAGDVGIGNDGAT